MASIGIDASHFNRGIANVVDTSRSAGAKISQSLSPKVIRSDLSRTAGLLTDPAAFIGAEERTAEMARRRERTMAAHSVWLRNRKTQNAEAKKLDREIYGGLEASMRRKQAEAALNRAMGFVPMTEAEHAAKKATSAVTGFARANSMLGGLLGAHAIKSSIQHTVRYASNISDLADRLGISTDAVQQWDFALKQNGSSIESASRFFERLAINRQKALKGNEEAINQFQRLGISMEDLRSKRTEDIAAQIGRAFQSGDPQALVADLRAIGGRAAGDMIGTFVQGFDGLARNARDLGLIISQEVVLELDEVGDRFDRLKGQLTSGFAPVLSGLLGVVSDVIDGLSAGFRGYFSLVGSIFDQIKEDPKKLLTPFAVVAEAGKKGLEGMREAGAEQDERDRKAREARTRKKPIAELDIENEAEAKATAKAEAKAQREADREALKAKKDEERLSKEPAERAPGFRELQLNQLQRIGAYVSTPTVQQALLDSQRRSEQHLASIDESMKDLAKPEPNADAAF